MLEKLAHLLRDQRLNLTWLNVDGGVFQGVIRRDKTKASDVFRARCSDIGELIDTLADHKWMAIVPEKPEIFDDNLWFVKESGGCFYVECNGERRSLRCWTRESANVRKIELIQSDHDRLKEWEEIWLPVIENGVELVDWRWEKSPCPL